MTPDLRARMLALLEAVQWNGQHDGFPVCPYCLTPQGFQPPLKHTCALAAMIEELRREG